VGGGAKKGGVTSVTGARETEGRKRRNHAKAVLGGAQTFYCLGSRNKKKSQLETLGCSESKPGKKKTFRKEGPAGADGQEKSAGRILKRVKTRVGGDESTSK